MNLAYIDAGSGTTVTILPFHSSHVTKRWVSPISWSEPLRTDFRVLTYDGRGQGLSTRRLDRGPSLRDYETDLATVLAAAGVERTVLIAYGGFAHVAARYYAAHPERVTALAMICASESFAAWPLRSMVSLAEDNWDLFVDFLASKLDDERKRAWPSFMLACAEPEEYVRMVRAFSESNISDIIGEIGCPTLVLHSLGQHWLSVDEGTRFAAMVPGSQLVFLDGDVEPDQVQGGRAIKHFLLELGLGSPSQPPGEMVDRLRSLTPRQQEVFRLLAAGKTNREIGEALVLSERTVERHIGDMYDRLQVRNRAEAAALASRLD